MSGEMKLGRGRGLDGVASGAVELAAGCFGSGKLVSGCLIVDGLITPVGLTRGGMCGAGGRGSG